MPKKKNGDRLVSKTIYCLTCYHSSQTQHTIHRLPIPRAKQVSYMSFPALTSDNFLSCDQGYPISATPF